MDHENNYYGGVKEILLSLKSGSVHYGGVQALSGVSVQIDEGEIIALMGPNGAGKSTVLKAIYGLAPLTSGEVHFHEQPIVPVAEHMPQRGIAYVPQGRQVFKNLTVYENLELGGYTLRNRDDVAKNIDKVLRIFPMLKTKTHEKAGLLSGGQQQMLTIARALVADPRVLLLDEPSLGLSPKVVKEVFALVKEINEMRQIAVLIVEHSIKSVLSIAERVYILAHGKVVVEQSAEEVERGGTLEKVFFANP